MSIIFPAFSTDKKTEIKSGLLICPEQQSRQNSSVGPLRQASSVEAPSLCWRQCPLLSLLPSCNVSLSVPGFRKCRPLLTWHSQGGGSLFKNPIKGCQLCFRAQTHSRDSRRNVPGQIKSILFEEVGATALCTVKQTGVLPRILSPPYGKLKEN